MDDSHDHLHRTSTFLMSKGFDCSTAENGDEALQKIHANDFDLCLMDIQMPIRDGLEATTIIREIHGKKMPIIAHTSFGESMRSRCLEVGMNDLITKPAKHDHLMEIINLWLN